MRSEKYTTHYLVGKCDKNDLYWHPVTGLFLDIEGRGLVEYQGGEVDWVPTIALLRDYNENPALLDPMPYGLRLAFMSFIHAVSGWREEEALDQAAKELGRVAETEMW